MMRLHSFLKSVGYLCFFIVFICPLNAQENLTEYRGKVVDSRTNKGLEAANLSLDIANIGTITNSEGEFSLKLPKTFTKFNIIVSLLGYNTQMISVDELTKEVNVIKLDVAITELQEVNVSAFKDASNLVKRVFKNRAKSVNDQSLYMTGFYRESIKRRNRNVSLTEAVVNILKEPNGSRKGDIIKLGKARKSTDYKRLDTVSVKLQGGPFSTVYLDIMKYPEYIFTDETIASYNFTFDKPTSINDRKVFVVDFKPKNSGLNLNYFGKLYIDVDALTLVSAVYALDVTDRNRTKNLLVKKKPKNIVVYPLEANYRVDYQNRGDKWYYSYSSLYLRFKVNKKRQLFNKVYSLASELAITDWKVNTDNIKINPKDRFRPTVIIADAISGFSDTDFWGEYNLIEPDKSIQIAIGKIQKNIKKLQD